MRTSTRAHVHADGKFEVHGTTYRLDEDRPGHFNVREAPLDRTLGGFSVAANGAFAVDTGSADVVKAIAELTQTPRGLLPIQ